MSADKKPTYEELEKRVNRLEDVAGSLSQQKVVSVPDEHDALDILNSTKTFGLFRLRVEKSTPPKLTVVYASSGVASLLGITNPLDMDSWFSNMHPDDRGLAFVAHFESTQSLQIDEILRIKLPEDKNWRWVHAKVTGIKEGQGDYGFADGTIVDVTEQLAAREKEVLQHRETAIKARELEEVNKALHVLMGQSREAMKKFENRMVSNVDDLVMPYVQRLKQTPLDADQDVYVGVIESNLSELVSPFMRRVGTKHSDLSQRELEIANMVRMGVKSKEIANLLNISKRAVEFHRDSIRKKLGLKNSKQNLRAYLASLQ